MWFKQWVILMGLMLVLQSVTYASEGIKWSYTGEDGPAQWGKLSKDYETCEIGKKQSPVNIIGSITRKLPSLTFNYKKTPLSVQNNGHTLHFATNQSSTLQIGNSVYKLIQFHTHTPSEEAINGKRSDMVIHFVHKNAQDKLAVVAVLFEKGSEESIASNPVLELLSKILPTTVGKPQKYEGVEIDIRKLLPENKNYYTYEGSLTIPPCTEGVRWIVLKTPIAITAEQLALYQKIYTDNARPLQALHDRKVFSSN